MTAVLMSVRPQHCENICTVIGYDKDGKPIYKKQIEVRKTKPKLEVPFKVYIYCTNPRHYVDSKHWFSYPKEPLWKTENKGLVRQIDKECGETEIINGKVIGEFVCDEIIEIMPDVEMYGIYDISDDDVIKTCLVNGDLWNYGKGKNLYGLHISDLEIYDKPKELSEFCKPKDCIKKCHICEHLKALSFEEPAYCDLEIKNITRPPQSWCYVEEVIA